MPQPHGPAMLNATGASKGWGSVGHCALPEGQTASARLPVSDLKARPSLCTHMHSLQEKLGTSLGGKTDTFNVFPKDKMPACQPGKPHPPQSKGAFGSFPSVSASHWSQTAEWLCNIQDDVPLRSHTLHLTGAGVTQQSHRLFAESVSSSGQRGVQVSRPSHLA